MHDANTYGDGIDASTCVYKHATPTTIKNSSKKKLVLYVNKVLKAIQNSNKYTMCVCAMRHTTKAHSCQCHSIRGSDLRARSWRGWKSEAGGRCICVA